MQFCCYTGVGSVLERDPDFEIPLSDVQSQGGRLLDLSIHQLDDVYAAVSDFMESQQTDTEVCSNNNNNNNNDQIYSALYHIHVQRHFTSLLPQSKRATHSKQCIFLKLLQQLLEAQF